MKNVTHKKFNHTKTLRNTTKLNNKEIKKYCQRESQRFATMMKLIEIVNSQTQSANVHRKVRLKRVNSLNRRISNEVVAVVTLLCILSSVSCLETRNNRPPRFLIDNQHSEIVLRLKEGPDTPVGKMNASVSGFNHLKPSRLTGSLIYKLKGFDPDGDALDFGVQSTYDSDIISVRNLESNEAGIYLEKELDREVIKH